MLKTKKELIELKNNFNGLQTAASERVKNYYENYKPDVKANEEFKLRSPIWSETRNNLRALMGKIPVERERINAAIDKVKYPNATSEDVNKKILAESYRQSALIFLSTRRKPEEIIEEMSKSLKAEKYECAFTIFESVMSGLPADGVYSASQKHLVESLAGIYKTFPGKPEIDKLVKELNEVTETELMIDSFENQLASNSKQAILLHSEMTDQEITEAENLVNSGTLSAPESISIKNRIFEYSQA